MGTKPRDRPQRLGEKLRQIRDALGLSQSEMVRQLGFENSVTPARISEYESGMREPSLFLLLTYSRLAQVHLEDIIDDNLDLPRKLPGTVRHNAAERMPRKHRE